MDSKSAVPQRHSYHRSGLTWASWVAGRAWDKRKVELHDDREDPMQAFARMTGPHSDRHPQWWGTTWNLESFSLIPAECPASNKIICDSTDNSAAIASEPPISRPSRSRTSPTKISCGYPSSFPSADIGLGAIADRPIPSLSIQHSASSIQRSAFSTQHCPR